MTIVTGAEHGAEDSERRVERDLGAVANEVEHLAADVAEHTTTIAGLKDDRNWITQRFEAIERDLAEIPRAPSEIVSTFSESLANLTHRIERLEAIDDDEPETKPPDRHRDESTDDERRDEDRDRNHDRKTWLDSVF